MYATTCDIDGSELSLDDLVYTLLYCDIRWFGGALLFLELLLCSFYYSLSPFGIYFVVLELY